MTRQLIVDPQKVLAAWPIPAPQTTRLANAGTNNRTYIVDTPAGSYLLRIYQNTNDLTLIRAEHALLRQLNRSGLSFAVPHPLVTKIGKTYAIAPAEGGDLVAALFPMIPGREPVREAVAEVTTCGEALGELDQALARIEVKSAFAGLPWFGQSGAIHPLVPDPHAAIEQLPLDLAIRHHLAALLRDLCVLGSQLYARLPEQVIHGDFFPGNVLMEEGTVSGVLDFEFASPGPRAMELAVALWGFGISRWRNSDAWVLIDAFAAGYSHWIVLTPAETGALPALIRLREATSLVHWIGRFRQGLTAAPDIARRTDQLFRLEGWMQTSGAELVQRVEEAAT